MLSNNVFLLLFKSTVYDSRYTWKNLILKFFVAQLLGRPVQASKLSLSQISSHIKQLFEKSTLNVEPLFLNEIQSSFHYLLESFRFILLACWFAHENSKRFSQENLLLTKNTRFDSKDIFLQTKSHISQSALAGR